MEKEIGTETEIEVESETELDLEEINFVKVFKNKNKSNLLETNTFEEPITIYLRAQNFSLDFQFSPSSSISKLRNFIIEKQDLKNKNIRLIFQGKLLEDKKRLRDYNCPNPCFIHCAISDKINLPSQSTNQNSNNDFRLRGFDRFRELGFSEVDIQNFRRQFHINQALGVQSNLPRDQQLDLEEQWFNQAEQPNQQNNIIRSQNRMITNIEGSYQDLFYGMIMGFLLGLIAIFWITDSSLTRRAKFGILAGIGCNLSFGLIRLTKG
eukprot:TRINITY_DN1308_c1_g1_i1.p1 TRINITY_DN1308_c1_g1~~TRINITY_DN1308_c1_g1_i1.p1  ORF type:complete len:293 (-),score=94.21 TRINITY_DN1308_c1_g1_i1:813-1610(-)